jgi:HAD superfamily hydrolase (TIGR01549 family)
MIKLIIFDLWRTLIPATIDFDHLFSLIKKTGMSKEEFIEKYERSVQLKKYSNITELKKDFFLAFRDVDDIILAKEFYEIYNNRFDKISFFDDVEKNLLKFKKNYKLALLSNTESLTIKDIEKKLSLKDYFDFLGYSFNIGAIKPDKKMFETVLKKFNVLPEEAVMVGDSLRSDIIGAKKLNINTILINRDKIKLDNTSEKADFAINSFDELGEKLGMFNEKKD